ncbi:MAG: dodecin domain-containing protein [Myxococcota bacterium]
MRSVRDRAPISSAPSTAKMPVAFAPAEEAECQHLRGGNPACERRDGFQGRSPQKPGRGDRDARVSNSARRQPRAMRFPSRRFEAIRLAVTAVPTSSDQPRLASGGLPRLAAAEPRQADTRHQAAATRRRSSNHWPASIADAGSRPPPPRRRARSSAPAPPQGRTARACGHAGRIRELRTMSHDEGGPPGSAPGDPDRGRAGSRGHVRRLRRRRVRRRARRAMRAPGPPPRSSRRRRAAARTLKPNDAFAQGRLSLRAIEGSSRGRGRSRDIARTLLDLAPWMLPDAMPRRFWRSGPGFQSGGRHDSRQAYRVRARCGPPARGSGDVDREGRPDLGSSPISFGDAAQSVMARANRTLRGITGFDVVEKRIKVEAGVATEYRVRKLRLRPPRRRPTPSRIGRPSPRRAVRAGRRHASRTHPPWPSLPSRRSPRPRRTAGRKAAELGLARARQTLRGITGIKILEEKARVEDGVIVNSS